MPEKASVHSERTSVVGRDRTARHHSALLDGASSAACDQRRRSGRAARVTCQSPAGRNETSTVEHVSRATRTRTLQLASVGTIRRGMRPAAAAASSVPTSTSLTRASRSSRSSARLRVLTSVK